MEIKALKCQSCGNGDLNFSSFRVAKCPCCGTVNIISGDLDLDVQKSNSPVDGRNIKICQKIAIGLFLREQGYFVADNNYEIDRISDELNDRGYLHFFGIDTRISDNSSQLNVYLVNKRVTQVARRRLFRPSVTMENVVYEVTEVGYFSFKDGSPTLHVSGREVMKIAEQVIDMISQGLLLQVDAELRHS